MKQSWLKIRGVAAILLLVFGFNFFFTPGFFHIEAKGGHLFGSLIDIVDRATPVMLLSLGMTLVIATGGVDLSVGSVMAIAGSLAGRLVVQGHYAFGLVLILCLLAGLALGLWNGGLISFVGVQPIVATLILMVAGRGIAQLLTNGQVITFENAGFVFLGGGFFVGLPFTYTIVVIAF